MTDLDAGADQSAAEQKTIEQTMAETFDRMNAAETSAPVDAPSEGTGQPSAEVPATEPPVSDDTRPRGPDGKFVEKKTEAAPKEAAPVKELGGQSAEPAKATEAPKPAATPPSSWSAEAKASWASLSPAIQQAVLKREQEASNGIKSYADKTKQLEPIAEALRPVYDRLRVNGVAPANYVSQLVAADEALRTNPYPAIQEIARMYGIDLNRFAAVSQSPEGQQRPQVDPILAALHQKVATLEQLTHQQQAVAQQAQSAELNSMIESFRNDPSNVYFENVRADMAAFLHAGRAKDLKEAYDMAIYANPEVRAQVIKSQREAEDKARADEAQRKAAEAKKVAQSNVATKGTVGASPGRSKSIEETMREVADRMMGAA